jgi:hypothetical protein
VIGPKKLSTIRQELRRELESTGHNPIGWLEARLAAAERERPNASRGNEVLESLMRFLGKKPRTKSRAKRSLRSKK